MKVGNGDRSAVLEDRDAPLFQVAFGEHLKAVRAAIDDRVANLLIDHAVADLRHGDRRHGRRRRNRRRALHPWLQIVDGDSLTRDGEPEVVGHGDLLRALVSLHHHFVPVHRHDLEPFDLE